MQTIVSNACIFTIIDLSDRICHKEVRGKTYAFHNDEECNKIVNKDRVNTDDGYAYNIIYNNKNSEVVSASVTTSTQKTLVITVILTMSPTVIP